jgi:phage terminase large subunit GpA-like protein
VIPAAAPRVAAVLARSLQPRKPLSVSQWADENRFLSSKGSAVPGRWVTDRNPPLREPMDCMSARNPVRDAVCMFPIQFGKTEIASNTVGYTMDYDPGPIMVCLPGEVSMNKWVAQKLNPMLEESPAVHRSLTSVASRDSANQRTFKDFAGGQLYLEHAGSPKRLKSTTVKKLVVDEIDEFPEVLSTGDDPLKMLEGRTSAFPSSYKRLYISTPGITGISRIEKLYLKSDQRRYHVPCPDCGHMQSLEWSGLQWSPDARHVWYVCRECGVCIEEHHKTAMIAAGRWVAKNPDAEIRGYTINCLYYQFGLGPRWVDLVREWLEAQNDPASLKTFINDRLAETWEDPAMRAVKHNIVADRAEPYRLRTAVSQVLAITAGIDTQDNRLAVHIIGWGRGMAAWTIDYVELPGDPADDGVWVQLTDLLNRPIERVDGGSMRILAAAIDAGGHRTEAVKHYVRQRMITRPMAIFGAVPNNAPLLSKGKVVDVNWRGRTDKRGITIYHVGTVAAKHYLYSRLGSDADKQVEARLLHFSEELPREFFPGLVSEIYNPVKNRFEKRVTRNEPLDTWVYAYAATHHPELRMHRYTKADWDALEARVAQSVAVNLDSRETLPAPVQEKAATEDSHETPKAKPAAPASPNWKRRW